MFKTKEQMHKERTVYAVDKVSKNYAPVSTEVLLMPFLNNGWYIHKQVGKGLGKQLTTLRHPDYKYSNGDFLSVESLNSFDGSSAVVLMGGYGRIACSNGLIIGDIEGGRFIHSGTAIYEKLENQYEKLIAHLDKIREDVTTLKEAEVTNESVDRAVYNIAKETFEKETNKVKIELVKVPFKTMAKLCRVRRFSDGHSDAFTVMNRVQEAIIRLGLLTAVVIETCKETGESRKRLISKNPMEGKISSVEMNKRITKMFLQEVA